MDNGCGALSIKPFRALRLRRAWQLKKCASWCVHGLQHKLCAPGHRRSCGGRSPHREGRPQKPSSRRTMTRLSRITLEGFRSIHSAALDLRPLNVLIGANGAGKSNFIAFLKLLNFALT